MSTYALIKYSEGRTSGEFDRRDFTHIHDKNLCMTVRSSPDIVVCIVQRNETKCTLPVEHLINLSVEERQQSQAHTLNRDSLSIYGLTKGSQLALQWRMPGEAEKNRIQVAFQNQADAIMVAKQLYGLGMEIDDRNNPPVLENENIRPRTSPASTITGMMAGTAGNCTDQYPMRPQSERSNLFSASPALSFRGTLDNVPGAFPRSSQCPSVDKVNQPPAHAPTVSPTPHSAMLPPSRGLSRDGHSSDTASSEHTIGGVIPPTRPTPQGFPPRPNTSEQSPRFGPAPGSKGSGSGRVTRSRGKTNQAAPPSRKQSDVLRAPAASLQKKTLALNERTTLLPPSAPTFYSTGNFRTETTQMHDQATAATAGSYMDGNRPDTAQSVLSSSPPRPDTAPANPFSRVLTEIASNQGSANRQQLATYAAQTDQERDAVLNQFIVEHLNDDNFLRLCEDMEGCWRLLGLGR
ncbi:hypothetical protein C1H76_9254 [Elsinoe australis]|uniref:Uncharacterized protein n=1 Tax=Elsinoe australis TaxID=40998 RepID=A0A4U7ANM3_9PEZI|nr:hypothetical protein C1H76_9254 [Elsinoe australis]